MDKRHGIGIGPIFVLVTFGIMFFSVLLIGFCASLLLHFGKLDFKGPNPHYPLMIFLLLSVLIGTGTSFIVSRMILRPILKISEKTKQVATGDFTVKLSERHNVRELSEFSQNFNVMVKELASIETLRSDFVVNVSHEFKTPIASIEGYATLLQDETLSAGERREYAKMIIDSSKQLSSLTGNILRLSKLENQESIAEKELFRLDEQIRQAILILEPQWTDKELFLDIILEKAEYWGNSQLMLQVWLNIIGNAVKFTPPKGEITVLLTKIGSTICVTVTDNGIGMPEDVQRHIFDKFYQGDSARAEGGNGLGLALAKRIVSLSEGEIEVQSKPGAGSTFKIFLKA